jgi:hypothetical protein
MQFLLVILFISSLSTSIAAEPIRSIQALQDDRANGLLTADQFALEMVRTIKTPLSQIPEQIIEQGQHEHRMCATAAILQIRQSWDSLSRTTQQFVTASFARPSADSVLLSPSGFFSLHYSLTGVNAVPTDDLDADMRPDYVEKMAAYMDTSLITHRNLGFLDPPFDGVIGGDSTFDVYFEDIGAYGYAVPEGPGPNPWPDEYSYLVVHNTFVGFPPNDDPEGDIAGAAKATCAHEFHHCVQFAYDPNEAIWLMELDATESEDLVYNATDDNYNYLNGYFLDPEISLMSVSNHMYSSFIWHSYIAQRFDTSLLLQLWNGARTGNAFQSSADSMFASYGITHDSAFTEFVSWLYKTNTRSDGSGFEEAASYPFVQIDRSHSIFPIAAQLSPKSPGGYASCWVEAITSGVSGNMRIDFDGNDARQWGAVVILTKGINQHTVLSIPLSGPNYVGSITVDSMGQYSKITLAGINLSENSAASTFTYGFTPTYTVSVAAAPSDSGAYSGASRSMKLTLKNFLPSGQVMRAVFSDLSGWVPLDSASVFVPTLDSAIVLIPVTVPVSTAIGTLSQVDVAVRSLSDTTQHFNIDFNAITVVKRGDYNFDGSIDIADLTYCVNYLFFFGDDPVPVILAGDFDCSPGIDIGDLTLLVDHLFLSFAPSPCQPD